MITPWFTDPHKLRRPYSFEHLAAVAAPFRRGLGDMEAADLPIFTPGIDYTPDILSSSWAATLGSQPIPGAVARYAGAGMPTQPQGGISPMMIGIGLLALILVSGGHK